MLSHFIAKSKRYLDFFLNTSCNTFLYTYFSKRQLMTATAGVSVLFTCTSSRMGATDAYGTFFLFFYNICNCCPYNKQQYYCYNNTFHTKTCHLVSLSFSIKYVFDSCPAKQQLLLFQLIFTIKILVVFTNQINNHTGHGKHCNQSRNKSCS